MKNRDTRKSKGFRKGAKKGRWRSFLVRALSPLSHAYRARYPSYGPVIKAIIGDKIVETLYSNRVTSEA